MSAQRRRQAGYDKLTARQRDFDQFSKSSAGGKGNGKWVVNGSGKNTFFTRPGSNK